jgi:hypothetical protein
MTTFNIISKSVLMQELAETRFGPGEPAISRITFWRWCKAVGISSGQSTYTSDATALLHRYAESRPGHLSRLSGSDHPPGPVQRRGGPV